MNMTELEILQQLKRKYDAEMVSALIGAGFTKNAYPKANDWNDMLKELVEFAYAYELEEMYQIYCHRRYGVDVMPFEEKKKEFVNLIINRDGYLGVVSKYIEKKGYRESIDYYIEKHNPYFYKREDGTFGVYGDDATILTDKNFTVHQRFLKGKWQYVFTTNFDNTLEFVNEQFNMGYIPVYADYQMSRRKMARPIVKIHGSIVAHNDTLKAPFVFDGDHSCRYIISKEDFDTYFQKHEAFSYLLRVAMLSGSYLLLGFSGDDPNFKSWLNWVKDIIDKETSSVIDDFDKEEKEALVKKDEDNLKVFLVLVKDEVIPTEQQLYYQNHHIGVIHLSNKEIMRELGCFDDTPTSIRLDHLLHYLIGDEEDATDELIGVQPYKESLSHKWMELYECMYKDVEFKEILSEIRNRRKEERFVKDVSNQEFILDKFIRRIDKLSELDKEVVDYLVYDTGKIRSQLGESIGNQMKGYGLWEEMGMHEESLAGSEVYLEGDDDMTNRENVLRAFYRLDFSKARSLLKEWTPEGNYKAVKASLNYVYDRTDSLKLLDTLLLNSDSDIEKYVASFLYNCIDNGFYPYHPLNEYRNKGLVGLNDSVRYIIEQLRNKKNDYAEYGLEETVIQMDGKDADIEVEYAKALRFIQLISREGFNLRYGIVNMVNVNDWYLAFRRIYAQFPYPCLYYSSQYNNKRLLRRIGQDYAFEPKLKNTLPELLHRVFSALSCIDTPSDIKDGMLQVGSQFFFGMKEDVWFDNFYKYFKEVYEVEGGEYLYSNNAKSFVQSAMVCLYSPDHISKILTLTLDYFGKKSEESIDFMSHRLRLDKLKNLDTKQRTSIEKIVKEASFKNVVVLLSILKRCKLHDKELVAGFVNESVKQIECIIQSDRYALYNFCFLAEDNPEVVKLLKTEILSRNVWDCGVKDGRFSQTNHLFIMHLGDQYIWNDEELSIIYENLKSNLYKIKSDYLKYDPILNNSFYALLEDMSAFAEKYPQIVEDETKLEIQTKLNLVRRYTSMEDALYSESPDCVDNACEKLCRCYRDGKFIENKKYFEILLSKCTMKNSPGITECLSSIAIAIHFCKKQIGKKYADQLYRLLLQYKGRDLRDLDLQVIHAGHALMEIAHHLDSIGMNDDNVKWWLDNEDLNRLNFMEY